MSFRRGGIIVKHFNFSTNFFRYIHLIPHPPTHPHISTLLLCAPDEHALDELKLLCGSVLHALKHLLYQPSLVPGGGCFETIIAALLMKTAQEFDGVQEMECSKRMWSLSLPPNLISNFLIVTAKHAWIVGRDIAMVAAVMRHGTK